MSHDPFHLQILVPFRTVSGEIDRRIEGCRSYGVLYGIIRFLQGLRFTSSLPVLYRPYGTCYGVVTLLRSSIWSNVSLQGLRFAASLPVLCRPYGTMLGLTLERRGKGH
ncbi:MAG: hypothetical protein II766_00570 [Paludibacteraceae bacterium]|nr:hypothetical protein [Paludibacteraceae bacterium]